MEEKPTDTTTMKAVGGVSSDSANQTPLETLGLDLTKLPPSLQWIPNLLRPICEGMIKRLDASIQQYAKDLREPKSDEDKKRLRFYHDKALSVRNIITMFLHTKYISPIVDSHVAYHLFQLVQNQFELFYVMLHESRDPTKPLFGDIFKTWYSSLLLKAAQDLPEAKQRLEEIKAAMNKLNTTQVPPGDENKPEIIKPS